MNARRAVALPDARGRFGAYGGRFVPETLMTALGELERAFEEAQAKGLGVVSLGSKMIDPPVVKRAQRIVKLAQAMGMA